MKTWHFVLLIALSLLAYALLFAAGQPSRDDDDSVSVTVGPIKILTNGKT